MHVHELLVSSQVQGLAEALTADLALVGLLFSVHCQLVSPKFAFFSKALLAQRADEGLLVTVRSFVNGDIIAYIAGIRTL